MKKLLFVGLLVFLYACTPKVEEILDKELPTVKVLSPDNHKHYKKGDTIHFVVQYSDNDFIRNATISLKDEYTSFLFFDSTKNSLGPNYSWFIDFPVTQDTAQKLYLSLTAEVTDKAFNHSDLGYKFHAHINE